MTLMESFIVCLHVFSGVQDPQWKVHGTDPRFAAISDLLRNHINKDLPSILGYKGYTVEVVRDNQTVGEYTVAKKQSVELEKLLLETAPEDIKQRLSHCVMSALEN